MPKSFSQAEAHLGPQGRLVIPARFRRSLGFEAGDTLIVRVEDGRLVLEKADAIKRRLKARFAKIPEGVSLAHGLLSERREEAKKETGE
jgi:AbrB family looped-hinge helix DNA binding protein